MNKKHDICLSHDEFLIVQEEDIDFKNPQVFLTYPGPGIVGPIIARQMIESLDLFEIGFFKSKYLNPVTIFMDNVLRHPYLIYSNKEGTIVLISIDYPVPEDSYLAIAEGLFNWIEDELKATHIIAFDGLPTKVKPEKDLVITAAEKEVADELKKYAVEIYDHGVVLGLSGALMSEALLRKIVGVVLMTPATIGLPDPEAAVKLIDVINDYFELSIDTQPLLEQAEHIRDQLAMLAEKQQSMQQDELPKKRSSLRESFV